MLPVASDRFVDVTADGLHSSVIRLGGRGWGRGPRHRHPRPRALDVPAHPLPLRWRSISVAGIRTGGASALPDRILVILFAVLNERAERGRSREHG